MKGWFPFLAVSILAAAALAGCIDSAGHATDAAGDAPSASNATVALVPANTTSISYGLKDWYIIEGPTGPDAPITAFQWKIPANTPKVNYVDPSGRNSITLEVIPEAQGTGDIETWTIRAFVELDGGLIMAGGMGSSRHHHRIDMLYQEGTTHTAEAVPRPSVIRLNPDLVSAGDDLYLFFTADSQERGNLSLAFRPFDKQPTIREFHSKSRGEMQEKAGGRDPVALPVTGNGNGYQSRNYFEFNHYGATAIISWTEPTLPEKQSPISYGALHPLRKETLRAEFEAEQGWGVGVGVHYSGTTYGQWWVRSHIHNTTLEAEGLAVEALTALTAPTEEVRRELVGFPWYEYTLEGPGSASVDFGYDIVTNNWGFIIFFNYNTGTTLEGLFGIPAWTHVRTFPGDLGPQPTVTLAFTEEGLHYTDSMGTTLTLAGFQDPWEHLGPPHGASAAILHGGASTPPRPGSDAPDPRIQAPTSQRSPT